MQSHKDSKETTTSEQKSEQTSIWKEDPLVAYNNFLKYAGTEVNESVSYNQNIKSLFKLFRTDDKKTEAQETKEESSSLTVHAYNGKFHPLTTIFNRPAYCSKLTLRNFNKAVFNFNFDPEIIPRIIGIDGIEEFSRKYNVAYRNIVPSEFSQATQLAGPMGLHEYLIDGNNLDEKHLAFINFSLNSDFNQTPIKIVVENCKGSILISGLDQDNIKKVFENKCKESDLKFTTIERQTHKLAPR